MTGVDGNMVLDRLVLPAVKVVGHEADGQAGEAGEKKMEAKGSADLLMSPFFFWEEVREEECCQASPVSSDTSRCWRYKTSG